MAAYIPGRELFAAKKPAAVLEAEAEGESGFGKGMFGVSGVGEIVFCEVAWYQNTFQEFHDYQIYLFIDILSQNLFIVF